jgi:hypothetical protein
MLNNGSHLGFSIDTKIECFYRDHSRTIPVTGQSLTYMYYYIRENILKISISENTLPFEIKLGWNGP